MERPNCKSKNISSKKENTTANLKSISKTTNKSEDTVVTQETTAEILKKKKKKQKSRALTPKKIGK